MTHVLELLCFCAGNGVFRSTFVGILLGPNAGILTNWLWSFLNAGVQVRCPACGVVYLLELLCCL